MIKKIKIELLSDMCVSDGSIYNSSIDIDICHDSYGLPYIPAKRLKGCIRECALELKDWGYDIDIDNLFGKEGNDKGKIIIHNAYISDRDKIINEIKQAKGTVLCHPQNILKNYSYIRTQTSIDYNTGIADDKSLRTMRVVNKGLIFEAVVDLENVESNGIKKLEDCIAIFKHIGISRTRGYGHIKAKLIDDTDRITNKNIEFKNNCVGLEYEITLNTTIVCKSVAGQEANSTDYIEGSKILGYIAQMIKNNETEPFTKWLEKSDIKCSNAYISDEGERLYEVPASLFEIKNDKINLRNKIYINNENKLVEGLPLCDKGLQLNQMKHCYVSIDDNGHVTKKSVEMETRYHHRRPDDKSIGRADSNSDSNSVFYQISSIKEGQKFKGFITGNTDYIRTVYCNICNNKHMMLGYGRNGEYGSCNIEVTDFIIKDNIIEKETDRFYVILKSPAIIYGKNAMYSTSADDLKEEILAAAIVKDYQDINVTKYINISVSGGYNVTWGHRKPTVGVFDKGTVIVFEAKNSQKLKIRTGQLWIGERNNEGFGEIDIKELSDKGDYKCEYANKKVQNLSDDTPDISKSVVLQQIARKLFKDFIRYKASIYVNSKDNDLNINGAWKATISNMIIMVKESVSVEEVRDACKERYNTGNDKKKKKGEKADKLLKIVCDDNEHEIIDKLLEEFQKNYNIIGFAYEKSNYNKEYWKLYFLRELLIQAKYTIRQREKTQKREED